MSQGDSIFFFVESFLQMCFEGKWLQNRLQADKNELRSLSAVDILGHQRGGLYIVPREAQRGLWTPELGNMVVLNLEAGLLRVVKLALS